MKIRSGFVSNSSSSSFIINKDLPKEYIEVILNPIRYAEGVENIYRKNDPDSFTEAFEYIEDFAMWEVEERDDHIKFSTFIDNFKWQDYYEIVKNLSEREIFKIYIS